MVLLGFVWFNVKCNIFIVNISCIVCKVVLWVIVVVKYDWY